VSCKWHALEHADNGGKTELSHQVVHGFRVGQLEVFRNVHDSRIRHAMYNLTVETAHTFFVGDGQWLVHNAGPCSFTSPGGLVWDMGSREGNRFAHVMEYLAENPNKPLHTVFDVQGSADLVPLLDEAWLAKGAYTVDPRSGNWNYVVDLGRKVGTTGETKILIAVKPGTSEVITAFPKR
jgi:hypothetical protein